MSCDVESDCDDVFTDDSKGGCKGSTGSEDGENHHLTNRKRRRGIIEKRRRDRINNSLSELRRLVPAAFEKQGSSKLEKAEILQMTVDHLRILHSKGVDVLSFDPHGLVMDYHSVGFRECASEVARYLVGFEGLNLQDPLRLRLISHLQCFSAQKSQPSLSPWLAVPSPCCSSFLRESRSSSSSTSDRSSSSMSVDGTFPRNSSAAPRRNLPLSSSSLPLATSRVQRSPVMPCRPWGAEMAY